MATGLKRINYTDIGMRRLSNNYSSFNKSRTREDIKKQRRASFSILENIIFEASMEAEKFEHEKLEHTQNRINSGTSTNNNIMEKENCNIYKNSITEMNENIKEINFNENKEDKSEKEIDDTILNRNDFASNTDYIRARRRRTKDMHKIYVHKKHLSDYDVVYLHVDSHDDATESRDFHGSTQSINGSIDTEQHIFRHHSNSDSNLRSSDSDLSSLPPTGLMKKASSHRDITSTQMYKDIYTDNLRQYGFLLAKQLGTSNKSPDQLRKSYLKNRKKALERREKSIDKGSERKCSDAGLPKSKLTDSNSNLSECDHSSKSSDNMLHSKYSDSLTDISNIGSEEDLRHVRKSHTVIRRKTKHHVPRDPSKRLSAPSLGINIEEIISENERKSSLPNLKVTKSLSMSSLSVPDMETTSSGSESDVNETKKQSEYNRRNRKLSVESQRRQTEAKERQDFRKSRLTSLDGMLSQADKLMKDIKRKSSTTLSSVAVIVENT